MKIVTFSPRQNLSERRVGVLLESGMIVDLREAAVRFSEGDAEDSFRTSIDLLNGGDSSLNLARSLSEKATHASKADEPVKKGRDEARVVHKVEQVKMRSPLKPYKIISIGANYEEHMSEGGRKMFDAPGGHWKLPSTVIGTDEDIVKSKMTQTLDYEIELAVVIGKPAKDVEESNAYDYVAGYTIFNDVSARDIMTKDVGRRLAIGKNLDTFSPMGPYLVTKDEVPDPDDLDIELTVNGEVRQKSSTSKMNRDIPNLISFFSSYMTLDPGDVITTGTPSGVALFRKPDPTPFYLKPGDVVEATIERLGTLRNRVVVE